MPAFTFEKISPPAYRGPIPPVANKKQRGVIVQMLDRFAGSAGQASVEGKRRRHRPQSARQTTRRQTNRADGRSASPAYRRRGVSLLVGIAPFERPADEKCRDKEGDRQQPERRMAFGWVQVSHVHAQRR